jgi:hypothetical protein
MGYGFRRFIFLSLTSGLTWSNSCANSRRTFAPTTRKCEALIYDLTPMTKTGTPVSKMPIFGKRLRDGYLACCVQMVCSGTGETERTGGGVQRIMYAGKVNESAVHEKHRY